MDLDPVLRALTLLRSGVSGRPPTWPSGSARACAPYGVTPSGCVGLQPAQLAALEQTGRQAGAWLSWHERTIVLDALEHLHATARDPAATPRTRRR